MARTRSAPEPLPTAPPGFVASAVRLPTPSRALAGRPEDWQTQAWAFYETVGELRSVAQWIGNVLSRATLLPAKREGRRLVPVEDGPAFDAMQALYGGIQGQAEMIQHYGVHSTIAGEEYVVNTARDDRWYTLAADKVTQMPGGSLIADFGLESGPVTLSKSDLVIRIWTPSPRDPTRPDSAVRASLGTLAQIQAYDRHIAAQLQSRLTGAGILFISSEVSFPTPPDADPAATQADNFMAVLGEAMMTPVANPGSASALVPIVAMVPTDALGKNELVKFWTELDNAVIEMRDGSIKRLALGMDAPPEVLLGTADQNHWNAWLSDESAVKSLLEPKLGNLNYAITEQYLRPAVKGLVDDPSLYYCIADTSGIRLRPNRSTEAIELYNLGQLSGEALLRETGFQPEDRMEEAEMKQWLLRRLSVGSTSPEQTQAALALLGISLPALPGDEINTPPPDHLRIDTQPQLVERNPPEPAPLRTGESSGLAAACNVLVYRALERAGNRLKNQHQRRTDASLLAAVDAYRTFKGDPDKLLEGAWDCAADVLGPYTDDVTGVIETLDFYARGLLASQRPHSTVVLNALMATRPKALAV